MTHNVLPRVQLLPMGKAEFADSDKARRFLLDEMPSPPNAGRYRYPSAGLRDDPGKIVLFQFDAHVIASAKLEKVERFPTAIDGYTGALWFDPDSIKVFDPVTPEVMAEVWGDEFGGFSQAKTILDPSKYPDLERRLANVERSSQSAPQALDLEALPADRVSTTVSRIVRDTRCANRVKRLHNYECQICGHTIALPNGSRYAEAHHLHPLGAPHDGPDCPDNILCVCPNHHAACDLGAMRLVLAELRRVDGHVISENHVLSQRVDFRSERPRVSTTGGMAADGWHGCVRWQPCLMRAKAAALLERHGRQRTRPCHPGGVWDCTSS